MKRLPGFLAASTVEEIYSVLLHSIGAGLLPKRGERVWFLLLKQLRFSGTSMALRCSLGYTPGIDFGRRAGVLHAAAS